MATVLAFEPRHMGQTKRPPLQEPGEVLLFTGIRYEQPRLEADEAARSDAGRRRARPRRRT